LRSTVWMPITSSFSDITGERDAALGPIGRLARGSHTRLVLTPAGSRDGPAVPAGEARRDLDLSGRELGSSWAQTFHGVFSGPFRSSS
jgi:hypothetical protein